MKPVPKRCCPAVSAAELEARARGGGQWRQLVSRLLADKALVSVKGLPVMTWRALKDAGVVVAGFVKRLQGELEQWVALAGQSATTTVCCELS